jgi:hypothetical protein
MSIKRKRSPGLSGQSLPQQVSRNQEKNTIDRIYWMSILYVECVKHYHTLYSVYEGALSEPNREGGVNPPRSAAVKEEDKAYATGDNPGKALLSDEA